MDNAINKNVKFAMDVMTDVGLEIDKDDYIVDQDTGDKLMFKGRNVKFNSVNEPTLTKTDILFDPLNNQSMMSDLFLYFTNKIDEQEGRYVNVVYSEPHDRADKGTISCKENNIRISSDSYYKDSLKYASLINKLNGGNKDYTDFDEAPVPPTKKRRS